MQYKYLFHRYFNIGFKNIDIDILSIIYSPFDCSGINNTL